MTTKIAHSQRGQSLMEVILALPVCLLLVVGAIATLRLGLSEALLTQKLYETAICAAEQTPNANLEQTCAQSSDIRISRIKNKIIVHHSRNKGDGTWSSKEFSIQKPKVRLSL